MTALALSAGVSATVCAGAGGPSTWAQAEPSMPISPAASPLKPVWAAMAHALPVGELTQRLDLLAALFVVFLAMAASWMGYQLYRGQARWLAAASCGPLTAVVVLHWLYEVGVTSAFPALPAAVLATLAVSALVRSLVHLGRVTTVARTRALSAAGLAALVDPPSGLPLVALLGAVAWFRGPIRARPRWRATLLVVGGSVVPAGLAAALVGGGTVWPAVSSLQLGLPPLELLEDHLPEAALYPALALVVLLVVPLRWRGGPTLVAIGLCSMVVQVQGRPLAPVPALLVLCCVATAGWVWLAGSMWPGRPRLDLAQAAMASVALVPLAWWPPWTELGVASRPLARRRSPVPIVRIYEQGLVVPGNVLLVHDPWLRRALTDRRAREGWRPDVVLEDASAVGGPDLLAASVAWLAQDRRVFADSFDAGGRWSPQWVLDGGPLFEFVGPSAENRREYTDLPRVDPTATGHRASSRGRLVRLCVERARFRRAVGDPREALEALSLSPPRERGLETHLALARSVRAHAGAGSELPPAPEDAAWSEAALVAEAGDLLYANGEHRRASELLAEAGAGRYHPAWGALARWQLRAGEDRAAHETLRIMAGDPDLRGTILETVRWLLARDRVADARRVLESLDASLDSRSTDPTEELATRLMVLRALAAGKPTPP